jgi:hypothetical protein
LTIAANSINRSLGLPDLYPFVLAPAGLTKLAFIHDCFRSAPRRKPAASPEEQSRPSRMGGIASKIFAKVRA